MLLGHLYDKQLLLGHLYDKQPAFFNSDFRRYGIIPAPTFYKRNAFTSGTFSHLHAYMYANPLRAILSQHNILLLDKIHDTNFRSEFFEDIGYTKAALNGMINNTKHILWFDIVYILQIADLSISLELIPSQYPHIDIIKLRQYVADNPIQGRTMINNNFRRQSHVVDMEEVYRKTNLCDENGHDKILLHDKMIRFFDKILPIGLYNNPLQELLHDKYRSDIIGDIIVNEDTRHQLGFTNKQSDKYLQSIFKSMTHITWFDMYNICRMAGYDISYNITSMTERLSEYEEE